jgi:hypothetical protein
MSHVLSGLKFKILNVVPVLVHVIKREPGKMNLKNLEKLTRRITKEVAT